MEPRARGRAGARLKRPNLKPRLGRMACRAGVQGWRRPSQLLWRPSGRTDRGLHEGRGVESSGCCCMIRLSQKVCIARATLHGIAFCRHAEDLCSTISPRVQRNRAPSPCQSTRALCPITNIRKLAAWEGRRDRALTVPTDHLVTRKSCPYRSGCNTASVAAPRAIELQPKT